MEAFTRPLCRRMAHARPIRRHANSLQISRAASINKFVVHIPVRHLSLPRLGGPRPPRKGPPRQRLGQRLLYRWAGNPYFYVQVFALAGLVGGWYTYHIERVPFSGRPRLNLLSPEFERKQGEGGYQQTMEMFKDAIVPEFHPAVHRVRRVLAKLVDGLHQLESEGDITDGGQKAAVSAKSNPWSPGEGLEGWTIHVVAADVPNAFVLPGNHVFIFTKMLEVCQNDDQLATVLGHEIAHNLCHHVAERMTSQYIFMGAVSLIAFLIGDFTLTSAFLLNYLYQKPGSRRQESEADQVGLLLMAASCFDPRQALPFWQRMDAVTRSHGGSIPEFMSTHPSDTTRIRQLAGWMDSALLKYENSGCSRTKSYLRDFRRMTPFEVA